MTDTTRPDEADPMSEGPAGDPDIEPVPPEMLEEMALQQALRAPDEEGFWEGIAVATEEPMEPVPEELLEGDD